MPGLEAQDKSAKQRVEYKVIARRVTNIQVRESRKVDGRLVEIDHGPQASAEAMPQYFNALAEQGWEYVAPLTPTEKQTSGRRFQRRAYSVPASVPAHEISVRGQHEGADMSHPGIHDDGLSAPHIKHDCRFLTHFTTWGPTTLAVVASGCMAVAVDFVPDAFEMAVFFTSIILGLGGVAITFMPLALGMRCARCGTRMFGAAARVGPDGRTPIRLYCPTCRVEWDTGLFWGGD